MDGLRAVEVIKSDPSTASIPIMMYTSQDGEVYAGEARSFGAAGVMSKLATPGDLSQVLGRCACCRMPRRTLRSARTRRRRPHGPESARSAASSNRCCASRASI